MISGPGLPSLTSLNLTTADIDKLSVTEISTGQVRTSNPQCGPVDDAYTNVTSLIHCFHYLLKLGTTRCEFKRNEVSMLCRYGGIGIVIGMGISGEVESGHCSDVALGLLTVIDGCTRPDMSVAGFARANGNGNIVVGGTNIEYATHATGTANFGRLVMDSLGEEAY
ncbi:hypothetical protein yc1106_03271 [Curvularia clavata]|uniref:Uncharacterized protein n=1 Tax=Curvularia clavata TaxID=95742 RepID=A0A9Q9DQW4_CURCL|nr:hypothetical protein yc1106_03271 [Curvularia clavata]